MSLSPGTRVSTYEILGTIGAGGMGEVYRARDTKLGRDVALKILPEIFALDADRRARFEREARTLAALNHPNIAHVYDAGTDEAGAFLVMELVEGHDLSVVIASGHLTREAESVSSRSRESDARRARGSGAARGLNIEDVSAIARQIIDALEAAHEAGIVHRDLKPANIKMREDGTVKVLDFGLAKALTPGGDDANAAGSASNSPTLTARATQIGMIVGTAAYMAPEQARGRAVDRRADIWAFGVVLYEMLTGKRAFEGEDISITLAGVLKEDVDWSALPAGVAPSWRRLLRRCLEKDPKRRLSAIADARLELLEVAEGPSPSTAGPASPALRSRTPWIIAAVAVLAAAGVSIAGWYSRADEPIPQRVEFGFTVPRSAQLNPTVSPDGRWIAYVGPTEVGAPNGANLISIRPLGGQTARPLAGTEGALSLAWAPDSRWIAFAAGGRVHRVDLNGGVVRLGELASPAGLTFLPDGDILAASNSGGAGKLFRVPAQGGDPVELPMPKQDGPAAAYTAPVMLPDGRRFLYVGWSASGAERALFVGSLDGAPSTRIVASDGTGQYTDGHLFFVRDRTVYAQRFDPSSLKLTGEPMRVADDVSVNAITGRAAYHVSANGVVVHRQGAALGQAADLTWFDRSGRALGTAGAGGNIYQLRLSRDGRRVAVVDAMTGASSRISVLDLGNGVSSRLTDESAISNDPVWSKDSQTMAYEAVRNGVRQLFTHQVGTSTPALAFESPDDPKWLDDWSADGQWLLFHRPQPSKLYAVKPGDPASLKLLFETTATADGAHFSPDAKWIAYQVTEGSRYDVWVASFPAFDQRRRVSPNGGGQAMWRGDGRELFFLTPQGQMMSVKVTPAAGGGLEFAAPVELFQTPLSVPTLGIDQYSVTADGQRFLVIRPRVSAASPTMTINVIVNWRGQ